MRYAVWIPALILFNLKLMGYITWSWWIVIFSPIWLSVFVLVVLSILLTEEQIDRLIDDDEDTD